MSRECGVSMFMTLLAAYAVLLGRYAGSEDVVVGTPVANRNRAETEDLIGFFVNTLVMRTDLSGDPSFREVLGRVRETALGAYAHQDVPFEQVVDALVADRDRSRTPLFQALLNYDFAETPDGGGTDLTAADAADGGVVAKFDLRLVLSDGGSGLAGEFEYSTALFDAATIERMSGHLVTLLTAVARDAGETLSRLPVLTPAERRQVLRDWNDTDAPVPSAAGPHELIAARAAAAPDTVAVVAGAETLTYGGLMARANRLAHYLRGIGVGTESVVAVCLPRGADTIVAVLAVWQAGGAYLPLDPEYPVERLAFMLADSGATVLVGTEDLVDELPVGRLRTVVLDDPAVRAAVTAMPADTPGAAALPDQLAYVIYTSGSTGRPKGVQVTHAGVVNYVTSVVDRAGWTDGGRFGLLQPVVTDLGNTVVFGCLASGGTLHVLDAAAAVDGRAVAAHLTTWAVDWIKVVPSHLAALAADAGLAWVLPARGVMLGGESAAPDWLATLIEAAGDRAVVNHYGPTESTIGVLTGPLTADVLDTGVVPLGGPLANTRVHVLDAALRPVPVGVPGELFVSGAQVARGYRGRPALTAERFLPDPFGPAGTRMYRTGDRVRRLPDGRLEFLGRTDQQLKVRGFRIEPGEVEAVLATHPGIRSAVVTADGEGSERRLVAYLVPADRDEGAPAAAELRPYVTARLPEYMMPSVVVELAEFPLTANGKTDHAALPAPGSVRRDPAGLVAARTETERVLAEVWAQVLGVERVGAEDNFFDLGGHSLLATQVISRIREVFGAEVPLSALFDRPTVRELASTVDGSATGTAAPPVVAVDRDQPLPLSFAQQRLWFLAELEPGSTEYNLSTTLRRPGTLDLPALHHALTTLVARHEVLRTRLVAGQDGVAHQVIDEPTPFPLPLVDLSAEPDPRAAARAFLEADARRPFDLSAGPLIRGTLLKVADDDHVLALALHHVVSDDWSGRILRDEITTLYDAFRAGDPDPLPPLPVQYADFALWQRQWLTGDVLDEQLSYWRTTLAGAPTLELPTDRPRPPVRSSDGGTVDFRIPVSTAQRLRHLTRESGTTLSMTLLAAVNVLLGRYAGTDDVVLGTPVANRNRAETENLIGFFVNTLVMRTDLSGDPSFRELLGRVRETALGAYAHQDLPFEQVVDALSVERDRSRSPLFQVLFDYDNGHSRSADTPDRPDQQASALPVRFDLVVTLGEADGTLVGELQYSTALFDPETIERLAGHLIVLLDAVATDADRRIGDLPLLTAPEREDALNGWNDTSRVLPSVGGVHELIAARAAEAPQATAVVCGEASLTYGELMERANQLAHHLRTLGVGAESVVGLCLPRGVDMVVAVLAVWQAGGAYLPLDPEYPADRLRFMLTDSGASVLVGQRSLAGDLPADTAVWLDAPDVRRALDSQPVTAPEVVVHPEQLAYVIYTSGSTGRPKGVQVAHGGVVNLAVAQGGLFGVGVGEGVLQFASFGFDAAVSELVVALVAGGVLVVASAEERADVGLLAGLVRGCGVRVATLPPSLLSVLEPADLVGLRTLVTAGERLDGGLAGVWGEWFRLVNAYGPTEATVCASAAVLE
ncbi:non-ribosomal peptide synthetase, partial [Streptomyces arenae]|uniref:non-ribosomal peptide synthetase n=1 Tax=Streptomyces arenae TaxID=29301 RepID=UPI0026595CDB